MIGVVSSISDRDILFLAGLRPVSLVAKLFAYFTNSEVILLLREGFQMGLAG